MPSFQIINFTQTITLQPHQPVKLFRLHFHPNASQLSIASHVALHTNASAFLIPVHIYNGHLKVIHHRPEIFRGQLDFGTLGVDEERAMTFTLRNENPVDVSVIVPLVLTPFCT